MVFWLWYYNQIELSGMRILTPIKSNVSLSFAACVSAIIKKKVNLVSFLKPSFRVNCNTELLFPQSSWCSMLAYFSNSINKLTIVNWCNNYAILKHIWFCTSPTECNLETKVCWYKCENGAIPSCLVACSTPWTQLRQCSWCFFYLLCS